VRDLEVKTLESLNPRTLFFLTMKNPPLILKYWPVNAKTGCEAYGAGGLSNKLYLNKEEPLWNSD